MNVGQLKQQLEGVPDSAIVLITIRDQDRDIGTPEGYTSAVAMNVGRHSVYKHVLAVEVQS
jgi:protein-L-isoaspartate O-methyltransferase